MISTGPTAQDVHSSRHAVQEPLTHAVSPNGGVIHHTYESDVPCASSLLNIPRPTNFLRPAESVTLEEILRDVALDGNFTLTQINILLRNLRRLYPNLPVDARSILKTPRRCPVRLIRGGSYIHMGLQDAIRDVLRRTHSPRPSLLKLQIHIDGMTVFKSSRRQLWPVLGRLINPPSDVFLIGLYSGLSKPINVHEFLRPVVDELKDVLRKGVCLCDNDDAIDIVLDCVIADAPARAYVRQVKQHSGYFACEKCTITGSHVDGRMTFPTEPQSSLRNDMDFRTRKQPEHHIGESPFEALRIDMISCFPLDYMHTLCLGVTRKLIMLWRCGPTRGNIRLPSKSIDIINERLRICSANLTCEFPRKCRTFEDVERWKATEFRQFLLYLGPVVLRGVLPEDLYNNFVMLSVAAYILCCRRWCSHYLSHAKSVLNRVVRDIAKLYGEKEVVFNVHCLVHMCQDVGRLGPMDNFSAFPFESFLRRLRKLINGPTSATSQIFRRVTERRLTNVTDDGGCLDDTGSTVIMRRGRQQTSFLHFGALITNAHPNNAVIARGRPSVVLGQRANELCVQHFTQTTSLFVKSLPSTDLRIFKCWGSLAPPTWIPLSAIGCKCLRLPCDEYIVFYPIVHSWRHKDIKKHAT
ncbi:unnamed protein product [Dicrocoelium dendriticum]|nr:unnamed protein product [Dicrocoelium dendriticum]